MSFVPLIDGKNIRINNSSLHDVLIVGGGAAGLSAALVLGRARRDVIVCDDGQPRNRVVEATHGFLTRDGCSPKEFIRRARADVRQYPSVQLLDGTVDRIAASNDGFAVMLVNGEQQSAARILLANGVRDALPDIDGLRDFWGKSVFVCPLCDGWEVQDRKLVVFGNHARQAIGLAQELLLWTSQLTVCVPAGHARDARDQRWLERSGCRYITERVTKVLGKDDSLEAIVLEHGERVDCEALFLAGSLRQACGLAQGLGCRMDDEGMLIVDDDNQTTVRGIFAAGDAVTSVHQLVVAAASGVRAATSIVRAMVAESVQALTSSHSSASQSRYGTIS